ncbi:conserved hypothetical protein [Roseibium sp. TrichSKD4]|nr:hypothetical protein [Roseibium sp. TrichSKD4]EFO31528.1 conserved hypothetical protein [Roseibium sp. TrichSKD4]
MTAPAVSMTINRTRRADGNRLPLQIREIVEALTRTFSPKSFPVMPSRFKYVFSATI